MSEPHAKHGRARHFPKFFRSAGQPEIPAEANEKNPGSPVGRFFYRVYLSFIPNRHDSLKQIGVKSLFLVSLATLIVSASYLIGYFMTGTQQKAIINDSRDVWHASSTQTVDKFSALLAENADFRGWLTIGGTAVDNPVYQAQDDEYYLTHNERREKSRYGALFLSSADTVDGTDSDRNLVIYGHNMKDGTMFGTLKRLQSLDFYKDYPTVSFSTRYKTGVYKIFAVFLLNAVPEDDNGYLYNIARSNFSGDTEFDSWSAEAYQRSLLKTGVDVKYGDNIITLVTCSSNFTNARLIVMARQTRSGESTQVDTSAAKINPTVRYPKRWYDEHKLAFPY